MAYLRQGPAKK